MFEPDLWFFQKIWNWRKHKRYQQALADISPHTVYLDDMDIRLSRLAYAVGQRHVRIKEAENRGGIRGNIFYLPTKIDLADDIEVNQRVYILHLVFSCMMSDINIVIDSQLDKSLARLELSLLLLPTVMKNAFHEYPPLKKDFQNLKTYLDPLLQKNPLDSEKNFYTAWIRSVLGFDEPFEDTHLVSTDIANKKQLLLLHQTLKDTQSKQSYDKSTKNTVLDFHFPVFWPLMPLHSQTAKGTFQKLSKLEKREAVPTGTEMKASPKETVKQVSVSENDDDAMPVTHVLEKVVTADIFDGGLRTIDGADELQNHYDALQELDVREVTRTSRKTQSIYQANISLHTEFLDDSEETMDADFLYDEWNYQQKSYLKDWCALSQHDLDTTDKDHNEKTDYQGMKKQIKELRSLIEQMLTDRRKQKKQFDGQEVDIDAVIDRYAELKAGISKTDKLYIKQKKAEKDVAILLLLDASLSTDSWVQGRRVLDVTKEAVYVLSHVFKDIFKKVGVFGFYSNTRRDCHYLKIKGFVEDWKQPLARIRSLTPTGYTRIGPALRHSIHLLDQVSAKKKVIIFLSDGKPTDYDAYEGVYGIEDVRQATREARAKGIDLQSLAIDKQAKIYFPQMFGMDNYQILSNSAQLPQVLVKLFARCID